MIKIEEPLYQWDMNRYVLLDEDSDVNFALVGADKCYTVASENCRAKIPNELLQEGADISVWRYKDDHTLEQEYFGVWQKPKPVDYEDKQEQAIQKRIDDAVAENQKKNDKLKYSLLDSYLLKSLEEYSSETITQFQDDIFRDQKKLKTINCPNLTLISSNCFYGCTSLVDIGNVNNVTNIRQYAFYNCISLTSLSFPNLVYGWTGANISSYAFASCKNLVTIDLPKAKSFDDGVFDSCWKLKEVYFPSMTGSISNSLFMSCFSLEKAIFPSAVTEITADYLYVAPFFRCSNLRTLVLKSTTLIELKNSEALIGNITNAQVALSPNYQGDNPGYIYVPKALVEEYKTATNWSVFADKFRAIEDYPEICNEGA